MKTALNPSVPATNIYQKRVQISTNSAKLLHHVFVWRFDKNTPFSESLWMTEYAFVGQVHILKFKDFPINQILQVKWKYPFRQNYSFRLTDLFKLRPNMMNLFIKKLQNYNIVKFSWLQYYITKLYSYIYLLPKFASYGRVTLTQLSLVDYTYLLVKCHQRSKVYRKYLMKEWFYCKNRIHS